MNVRYRVELNHDEQQQLQALLSKGVRSARKLKRAQVLLAAHQGCHDQEIAANLALGLPTVYRTKRRFVEHGLQLASASHRARARSARLSRETIRRRLHDQCMPPDQARRILRRIEFHYTPKHASWLNMVKIEIGVSRVLKR